MPKCIATTTTRLEVEDLKVQVGQTQDFSHHDWPYVTAPALGSGAGSLFRCL
jgi:hypothetical protein